MRLSTLYPKPNLSRPSSAAHRVYPFVVRRQHLRLELGRVGAGGWVLAAAFLAVAAEVFLLAVWRFAAVPQVEAAAVAARKSFSDHDDSIY